MGPDSQWVSCKQLRSLDRDPSQHATVIREIRAPGNSILVSSFSHGFGAQRCFFPEPDGA